MKRKLWIFLLVVGIIPFIIPLGYGIYSAINGFDGFCLKNCDTEYGLRGFFDIIFLYSFVYWPTYIIGLVLIIISAIKLKKK